MILIIIAVVIVMLITIAYIMTRPSAPAPIAVYKPAGTGGTSGTTTGTGGAACRLQNGPLYTAAGYVFEDEADAREYGNYATIPGVQTLSCELGAGAHVYEKCGTYATDRHRLDTVPNTCATPVNTLVWVPKGRPGCVKPNQMVFVGCGRVYQTEKSAAKMCPGYNTYKYVGAADLCSLPMDTRLYPYRNEIYSDADLVAHRSASLAPVANALLWVSDKQLEEYLEKNKTATPAPPPPTCIARSGPIYVGCNYAYESEEQAKKQCGDYKVLKFIGDGIADANPCKLQRGRKMFQGCGHVYADYNTFLSSCGQADAELSWIADNPIESLNQCVRDGDYVYVGCGRAYQTAESALKMCGTFATVPYRGVDNLCDLPMDTKLYYSCNGVYSDHTALMRECGAEGTVLLWVSDAQLVAYLLKINAAATTVATVTATTSTSAALPSQPPAPAVATESASEDVISAIPVSYNPPPPPPPCIARDGPIYVGCGYAYGSLDQAKAQCGEYKTLKFIGDSIQENNPCKLPRGAKMYAGCGYVYGDEGAFARSCGQLDSAPLWIPDGLQ